MQYSVISLLAAAFAASVVAIPTGDTTPISSPCAPASTPASSPAPPASTHPTPSTSSPVSSAPAPTGTAPTFPTDCAFTCTQDITIEILNCVNVITGTTVGIPINALNPPAKRNAPAAASSYCCKPGPSVISAATCVDVLTGDQISIPINLLNGSV